MNLYDEEKVRNNRIKNKKMKKYVTIGIIVTLISIIALMIIIFYLIYNPNKTTVYVNGKEDQSIESILASKISPVDDSTIFYFPIRRLASYSKYWTYNSYDGEGKYGADYESKNSCYIISEKEVTIFNVNSNIIYKINLEQQSSSNSEYEYEEIKLDNPIVSINDELYMDLTGIQNAFNTTVQYSSKSKRITITTLDSYIASANNVVTRNKYKEMDKAFVNQRAVLDNRIVVLAEDGSKGIIVFSNESNGKTSGTEIRGAQYLDITYIPQKGLFKVRGKNNKVGIVTKDGEEKIGLKYDNLTLIDNENDLYLAQNGSYYGVIDINENTIIHLEYDKIGVDINSFVQNGVKNGYILLGKLIPVQQQGKWKLYNIQKNTTNNEQIKFTSTLLNIPDLDGIGCITKNKAGIVSNILAMVDYDILVVQKNGFYGLLYPDGKLASSLNYTDMYIETSSGNTNYYMVEYSGETKNMLNYFQERGITKIK